MDNKANIINKEYKFSDLNNEIKTKLIDINDYIKETEIDSLHLMTAGTQSPHPSELMSYKNISKLKFLLHRITYPNCVEQHL